MSNWTVEYESSGGVWMLDDAIPRPNEDLETEYISTQQKLRLANGSNAFITPETKRVKEPINMFFYNTTSGFRSQIETYMLNGEKVRITTHTGETFIGRFISMRRVWLTGLEPDVYDVNIIMERLE